MSESRKFNHICSYPKRDGTPCGKKCVQKLCSTHMKGAKAENILKGLKNLSVDDNKPKEQLKRTKKKQVLVEIDITDDEADSPTVRGSRPVAEKKVSIKKPEVTKKVAKKQVVEEPEETQEIYDDDDDDDIQY